MALNQKLIMLGTDDSSNMMNQGSVINGFDFEASFVFVLVGVDEVATPVVVLAAVPALSPSFSSLFCEGLK